MSGNYVAPTGYVDLDNDCEYSIDLKSTRSRETIDPKQDLSFYFNTYLVPKYGLDNINVNNAASFMKELDMNWTKLNPQLQGKVMDILVDGILNKDGAFKQSLMSKLNIQQPTVTMGPSSVGGGPSVNFGKSSFGSTSSNKKILYVVIALIILAGVIYGVSRMKNKPAPFSKFV